MKTDREQTISAILDAASTPCPAIVPIHHLLATDGTYRGPCGFPAGVEAVKPYERKLMGYAFRDKRSGTTYGKRMQSEQELRDLHAQGEASRRAEFKKALDEMTDKRLAEQAAYWLKTVSA